MCPGVGPSSNGPLVHHRHEEVRHVWYRGLLFHPPALLSGVLLGIAAKTSALPEELVPSLTLYRLPLHGPRNVDPLSPSCVRDTKQVSRQDSLQAHFS